MAEGSEPPLDEGMMGAKEPCSTLSISTQAVEEDEVLVSFDVVPLFTRITTNLAVQGACQCLQDDPSLRECTSVTPSERELSEIVSLLELCLNAINVFISPYLLPEDSLYSHEI